MDKVQNKKSDADTQFCQNLKYLRELWGLNKSEFARMLKEPRQNVVNWEILQGSPSSDKMLRISHFFNLTVDMMMTQDISKLDMNLIKSKHFCDGK